MNLSTPLRFHAAYLLLFALAGAAAWVAVHSWIQEHDARLTAETQTKASQQIVSSLQEQITARNTQARTKVDVIRREQAAVKTPEQAVLAMPDVSNLPVAIARAPNGPDYILPAPDVLPLYNVLAEGKRCAIELDACQANYADQLKINGQLQGQVDSWKKAGKGTFWSRALSIAKNVGIGIAVGIVAAKAGKL